MDKKYAQENPAQYDRCGSTFPRVDISFGDLQLSGESLSASVLGTEFVWGGNFGNSAGVGSRES
jgi:hypothetical protein